MLNRIVDLLFYIKETLKMNIHINKNDIKIHSFS